MTLYPIGTEHCKSDGPGYLLHSRGDWGTVSLPLIRCQCGILCPLPSDAAVLADGSITKEFQHQCGWRSYLHLAQWPGMTLLQ